MGADSPDTWDGSGDNYIDGEGVGMIKPIEPGCLAIIAPVTLRVRGTCSPIQSHTVTVIERVPSDNYTCRVCRGSQNTWRINSPFCNPSIVLTCACRLTRIDGGDPDAITETDKEKDHAYND